MDKFEKFRNEYKQFIYKRYEIINSGQTIKIKYYFEILGLEKFEPEIEIQKNDKIKEIDENSDNIKKLVFNIGMIELLSYWKCTCAENLIVQCGYLNEEQIEWFKKLYYYGLGEFRYINNIDVKKEDMINIIIENNSTSIEMQKNNSTLQGTIIPIGGGKDSTVTLELLKQYRKDNLCLMINAKEPSIQSAKIAGYTEGQMIFINRKIDIRLLELNERGFLNGHTPFSALLAFLSYFVAYITNKKYIALSNESSSNENNVQGEKINHQYSKSFEVEQDFRNYANTYLMGNIEYFSMLRPLNELQIAKLFSKNTKYHEIFKSCNVGSKTVPWNWCCNCPKCLFVYIILSPFLYKENLVRIFKQDLFEKQELLNTFIELCGYGETKPFECVGTYEEVNAAITKTIKNIGNSELPYLLKYYKENFTYNDSFEQLLEQYNTENNLTKEFEGLLKGEFQNDN